MDLPTSSKTKTFHFHFNAKKYLKNQLFRHESLLFLVTFCNKE